MKVGDLYHYNFSEEKAFRRDVCFKMLIEIMGKRSGCTGVKWG